MSYTPPSGSATNFTVAAGQSYSPPSGAVTFAEDYPGLDPITGTVNFTVPDSQSYSPPSNPLFEPAYVGLDPITGTVNFTNPSGQSYTPPTVPVIFSLPHYGRRDFVNPSGQSYTPPSYNAVGFTAGYAGLDAIPGGRNFTVPSGQSYSPPNWNAVLFETGYAGHETIPGGRDFTVPSGQSYSAPSWNAVVFSVGYAGYETIPGGRDFTVPDNQSYTPPTAPITFTASYAGYDPITGTTNFTVYPNQAYTPPAGNAVNFHPFYAAPYQRPTIYDSLDARFLFRYRILIGTADACFCRPTLTMFETTLLPVVPDLGTVEIEGWRDRNWLWVPSFPPVVPDMVVRIRERPYMVTMAATLAVTVPTITFAGAGDQDTAMTDGDGEKDASWRHQTALRTSNTVAARQQQGIKYDSKLSATHATAGKTSATLTAPSQEMLRQTSKLGQQSQHGIKADGWLEAPYAEAIRFRRNHLSAPAQETIKIEAHSTAGHAEQIRTRNRREIKEQQAISVSNWLSAFQHQRGIPTASLLRVLSQEMADVSPGMFWPYYHPECEGLWASFEGRPHPYTILVGIADASFAGMPAYHYHPNLFCPELSVWLPIVPEPPPPPEPDFIIPVLEVYFVSNSFSLVRASDNAPLYASDFTATIDADSWTWSWSAKIHSNQQSIVEPDGNGYREVIATINGNPIRLIVEKMTRQRRFPEAWLTISGRGRAAWLAEPSSVIETRVNTQQRTAQQLLNDALKINGVPIGWDVTWGLTDWSVPAGEWSHSGTYMDAAIRIAEAGGGYIQGHDTDKALIVKPYYPVAPWNWSGETPNIVLPEDVCETEDIEWFDKAAYNAVWIVGGTQGRKDKVRIGGTAGDVPAPTVVDQLATDYQMSRQRGMRILGDTGRQAHITLKMPILPGVGIIHPGNLIDYTENNVTRRGLSRGVSITHQYPQTWQSVRLETHE